MTESNRTSNSSSSRKDALKKILKWAVPIIILVVLFGGSMLVAVQSEPDYFLVAHELQAGRRNDQWDEVGELMHPDYLQHGGEPADLIGYLSPGISHTEYYFPAPVARVQISRVNEGLAVGETNREGQVLCTRLDEDDQWRIAPTPFLLHKLQEGEPLDYVYDEISMDADLVIMPRTPPHGWNQARFVVDPVWIRKTPSGTLRILLAIDVTSEHVDLNLHSILENTQWYTEEEEHQVGQITWSNVLPTQEGYWPLNTGRWFFDLEWDEVPESEFSLEFGTFISDDERKISEIHNLNQPR